MVVNYGITSRDRTKRDVDGSGAVGTMKEGQKATKTLLEQSVCTSKTRANNKARFHENHEPGRYTK